LSQFIEVWDILFERNVGYSGNGACKFIGASHFLSLP